MFGIGKKVHFVEAQIDFSPEEMEVVRTKRLGKYVLITGGDDNTDYQVKDFAGRTMPVRFADFLAAQAFENEFRENLHHLKTLIDVGGRSTNRTDTFEL